METFADTFYERLERPPRLGRVMASLRGAAATGHGRIYEQLGKLKPRRVDDVQLNIKDVVSRLIQSHPPRLFLPRCM